jgi:Protein of unknown function (DUF4013)
MDIGKSFGFVFEDARWVTKILIAAAILVVGILFSWLLAIPLILALVLVAGYQVEITRRVLRGGTPLLPEWENWGALLADGFKYVVVGIVYALPMILVSVCLGIPAGILDGSSDTGAQTFGSLISICSGCLSFLWVIAMSLVLPAAVTFWVANDQLSAAFRFGEVIRFTYNNLKTYLLTMIMTWVAQLIGSIGTAVCGVGWLATYPYSIMIIGHLYGQAYLQATGQAAAPAPVDVVDVTAPEA